MRTVLIAGSGLMLSLASAALAADTQPFDQKLGLWETTTVMETEGMPAMPARPTPQIPKETLDKMPPAQRAQVEAMLKNSSGTGGPGSPRTITSKSCTTKETLSKNMGVPDSKGADCKREIVSASASKIQMHLTCTPTGGGPASQSDVTMERIDGEHVKGTMVSKTNMQERALTMKMTFSSKWISADCGDVKPYTSK